MGEEKWNLINYNMRCIEIGNLKMASTFEMKINYNMRCIEMR